jgi:hypothetical protein
MAEAKILATIQRTDTEQLQISVSEYRGKSYFNLRIFYTTDDGAKVYVGKNGEAYTYQFLYASRIEYAKAHGACQDVAGRTL